MLHIFTVVSFAHFYNLSPSQSVRRNEVYRLTWIFLEMKVNIYYNYIWSVLYSFTLTQRCWHSSQGVNTHLGNHMYKYGIISLVKTFCGQWNPWKIIARKKFNMNNKQGAQWTFHLHMYKSWGACHIDSSFVLLMSFDKIDDYTIKH